MQFLGKHMMQTQLHGKKPHLGPNLDPLDQNSDHLFFQKFALVSH